MSQINEGGDDSDRLKKKGVALVNGCVDVDCDKLTPSILGCIFHIHSETHVGLKR